MATFFDYIFLLNTLNQAQIEYQRQLSELNDNINLLHQKGIISKTTITAGELLMLLREHEKEAH